MLCLSVQVPGQYTIIAEITYGAAGCCAYQFGRGAIGRLLNVSEISSKARPPQARPAANFPVFALEKDWEKL